MAVKPKTKKKANRKRSTKTLKQRRELFCQFFVRNSETRSNATLSYGEAFDYKLDTLPKDDAVFAPEWVDEDGDVHGGERITPSTYDKAYQVCATEGARLLKIPEIQDRITDLRNEMLEDRIVDGELEKVIMQDIELAPKLGGIREYNALRNRVQKKIDVTTNGKDLPTPLLTYVQRDNSAPQDPSA